MPEHSMSVKQAADYLCVDPRTVRALIHEGRLRACKVGRYYSIPEQEVKTLISSPKPDKNPKSGKKQLIKAIRGCLAGTDASMEEFLAQRRRDAKHLARKPERSK